MSKILIDDYDLEKNRLSFSALRGFQAGRPFYVVMCQLNEIRGRFSFSNSEISPEMRAQRTLRKTRIPAITNYILKNPKDYILSSITASVDGTMEFFTAPGQGEDSQLGALHIAMGSTILINDGQHRAAAIEEAVKQNPELGNEYIPVVFFEDKDLKRSQQMFADLNKNAVKPTKSLGILYDHRDSFAQFVVKLANNVELFRGRVELERTAVSKKSTKLFTLNGIADATRNLLRLRTKSIPEDKQKLAVEFWETVTDNIPEWRLLIDKNEEVKPDYLRENFVHMHTNILNALGLVGYVLTSLYPEDWKEKIKKFKNIDWSKSAPQWQGKIIVDGTMVKNKVGTKLAANEILHDCGITKTIDEFQNRK